MISSEEETTGRVQQKPSQAVETRAIDFKEFDVKTSLCWDSRYEALMDHVDNELSKKLALVEKVRNNLSVINTPESPKSLAYAKQIDVLKRHYNPKSNKIKNFSQEHEFDIYKSTWKSWVSRYETMMASAFIDPSKKHVLLLHYMGAKAYYTLCKIIKPESPESLAYAEIIDVLERHFNPKPKHVEIYKFRLRKQGADETCAQYLTALKDLANGCNFGMHLDMAVLNQFVFGLYWTNIQSRLLKEKTLTLARATYLVEKAEKRGLELHQARGTELVNKLHEKENAKKSCKYETSTEEKFSIMRRSVNTHDDKRQNAIKVCYRCGDYRHFPNKCPFINSLCGYCHSKGHLSIVCRIAKRNDLRFNGVTVGFHDDPWALY